MSLQEELSLYWTRLQERLSPLIEAMVSAVTPPYKKLVAVLELARLETFLPDPYHPSSTPSEDGVRDFAKSSKAGGAAQEDRCVRLQ